MFSIIYPLEVDDTFLQNKLTEALGVPRQWHRKDFFSWNTRANVTAYKSEKGRFVLMGKNDRLAIWPEK